MLIERIIEKDLIKKKIITKKEYDNYNLKLWIVLISLASGLMLIYLIGAVFPHPIFLYLLILIMISYTVLFFFWLHYHFTLKKFLLPKEISDIESYNMILNEKSFKFLKDNYYLLKDIYTYYPYENNKYYLRNYTLKEILNEIDIKVNHKKTLSNQINKFYLTEDDDFLEDKEKNILRYKEVNKFLLELNLEDLLANREKENYHYMKYDM